MKRKIIALASLVSLAMLSDCTEKSNEKRPPANVQVAKQFASSDQISRIANFIKENRNENQPLQTNEFPENQLIEIMVTIDGVQGKALGIESTAKKNKVLLFKISANGDIDEAFITDTEVQKDASVLTKYYSIGGDFFAESVYNNGKFVMQNIGGSATRMRELFSRTGNCVSTLTQPFKNGIYNMLFDIAATAVAGMWYPVVLVAACAVRAQVEMLRQQKHIEAQPRISKEEAFPR